MKYRLIQFAIALFLSSQVSSQTSDQAKAKEQVEKIKSAVDATAPKIASSNGVGVHVKVNGKLWQSSTILPPQQASRIIGQKDEEYVGLPYDERQMIVGNKGKLGPDNAVDVNFRSKSGLWFTQKGLIEITKVDDKWVEGKFSATLKERDNGELMELTEGFFRIPAAK